MRDACEGEPGGNFGLCAKSEGGGVKVQEWMPQNQLLIIYNDCNKKPKLA